MTNEEAIKLIEVAKAVVGWEYPLGYQIAFDKAIKALNECKAEKPLEVMYYCSDGVPEGFCPRCGLRRVTIKQKACGRCGKRLDWSEWSEEGD